MFTILSDLSEVFCRGLFGIGEVVCERYGEEVARLFEHRLNEKNEVFRELLRGKITEEKYWKEVLERGDLPFSVDDAKAMLSINMAKTVPGTLSVYKRIIAYPRRLGGEIVTGRPRIVLVSDHVTERLQELHRLHPEVFGIIWREFWSCEIGKIKQDPGFFPELLANIGLRTDEVIFVDDMESNVRAANDADVYGILFKNAAQLERGLKDYGFHFGPPYIK